MVGQNSIRRRLQGVPSCTVLYSSVLYSTVQDRPALEVDVTCVPRVDQAVPDSVPRRARSPSLHTRCLKLFYRLYQSVHDSRSTHGIHICFHVMYTLELDPQPPAETQTPAAASVMVTALLGWAPPEKILRYHDMIIVLFNREATSAANSSRVSPGTRSEKDPILLQASCYQ